MIKRRSVAAEEENLTLALSCGPPKALRPRKRLLRGSVLPPAPQRRSRIFFGARFLSFARKGEAMKERESAVDGLTRKSRKG
jgi:hypothetical protein